MAKKKDPALATEATKGYEPALEPLRGEAAPEKLKIALVELNDNVAEVIKALFEKQQDAVETVEIFRNRKKELFAKIESNDINAVVVNIFHSKKEIDGIEIIEQIGDHKMPIPVCILGTKEQLAYFSGLSDSLKVKFQHYCKLEVDHYPEELDRKVREMSKSLLGCRRTQVEKKRYRDQGIDKLTPAQAKEYKKIQEEADRGKSAIMAQDEARRQSVIPGINVDGLEKIIVETLKKASGSIDVYKWVNVFIILGGMALIGVSVWLFACGGKEQLEALGFGTLGLGGMIASLITNPTSSIGKTARQIIQIQIGYFGFLKQIDILNKVPANEMNEAVRKSERLEKTIESLQEMLCRCFEKEKRDSE